MTTDLQTNLTQILARLLPKETDSYIKYMSEIIIFHLGLKRDELRDDNHPTCMHHRWVTEWTRDTI